MDSNLQQNVTAAINTNLKEGFTPTKVSGLDVNIQTIELKPEDKGNLVNLIAAIGGVNGVENVHVLTGQTKQAASPSDANADSLPPVVAASLGTEVKDGVTNIKADDVTSISIVQSLDGKGYDILLNATDQPANIEAVVGQLVATLKDDPSSLSEISSNA